MLATESRPETASEPSWLLLITTLPGQNGATRISTWRALKALGAANLRDGAYALPNRPELADALREVERDVIGSGGAAYLLHVAPEESQDRTLRALFDRTPDYTALAETARALITAAGTREEADVRRAARQLRRDLTALDAIDYFTSPGRTRAHAALRDLDLHIDRTFSPGEPKPIHAGIERRNRTEYHGRTWTTRRRLWVDRVACAWLIRRSIDDRANFLWLDDPAQRPKNALGFDFDGADFTHVDDLTSFEVLLVAFDLTADPALAKIAAIVHALDIGGGHAPEAPGFEAILSGIRERSTDDHELLVRMTPVLDALYDSFAK